MNLGPPDLLALPRRHKRVAAIARALSALAVPALLAGCGGGGSGSVTTAPTIPAPVPPTPTPAPTGQSVSAPAGAAFTATLAEDRNSIGVGGTVTYTFTLANTSGAPATVVAGTAGGVSVPLVALRISGSSGQTVYPPITRPGLQPHDTPPAPPVGGGVTLQPGQSLTLTRALAVFGRADTYQAVATFTVAATSADTPQTVTLSALPLAVK